MAASDSFHHLLNQIVSDYNITASKYTNILAIIGAIYVSHKCLKLIYSSLNFSISSLQSLITHKDFSKEYGAWAVITGCTDGIGLSFSFELASKGMNIILLSRNEDKLTSLKNQLIDKFNIEVEYIVVDFNNFENTFEDICDIFSTKNIGILVNNVGVMNDYPEIFSNIPIEKISEIINVNILATTRLTHLVLNQLVLNKRGAIITLSSASSIYPTSLFSVYSASKEYLKYLTRCIEYEHRGSGVTFLTLYPFYVSTKMTSYADRFKRPTVFVPNAETYVKSCLKHLGRSDESSAYFPHRVLFFVCNLLPQSIWMWITYHTHNQYKKEKSTDCDSALIPLLCVHG